MVKMQLDLGGEEDRIVEAYRLANRLKTKPEAIRRIIQEFGLDCELKKRYMQALKNRRRLKRVV